MCKLLGINNLDKIKFDTKKIEKIAKIMERGQADGIGFAITNDNENIFHRGDDSSLSIKAIGKKELKSKIPTMINVNSNSYKLSERENKMFLLHSRTSTNEISIDSTHPFNIDENYFFAHNGVIEIPILHDYETITSNDSEFLAHDFLKRGKKSLNEFLGYAAIISIKNEKMHIFRDDKATLYVAYSEKLDTYIFTTKLSDCIEIGDILSSDFTFPELIESNTYLVIDQKNNIEVESIKRKKIKHNIDRKLMKKSIGYDDDDDYAFSKFSDDYDYKNYNDDYDDEAEKYLLGDDTFLDDDERDYYINEIKRHGRY